MRALCSTTAAVLHMATSTGAGGGGDFSNGSNGNSRGGNGRGDGDDSSSSSDSDGSSEGLPLAFAAAVKAGQLPKDALAKYRVQAASPILRFLMQFERELLYCSLHCILCEM
jgi:hypothetical protein